jgi:hypothetical protein
VINMPILKSVPTCLWQVLGATVLALGLMTPASAQTYDFNRFLSGGGGGQDPQKRQLAQSMGSYICVNVGPGIQANTVRFTLVSKVPQPRARINTVAFDLGRHAGLLSGISVTMGSPGVKGAVVPAQQHPFLRGMSPEFMVNVPQSGHMKTDGLSPGRLITISATLGPGKSIGDVLNALNEGLNPTTGVNGLRVGVIVLYLLGGPPPGVATIQDDGGFVTAGPSSAC